MVKRRRQYQALAAAAAGRRAKRARIPGKAPWKRIAMEAAIAAVSGYGAYKTKPKAAAKKKQLVKRVRRLEKDAHSGSGKHIVRKRDMVRVVCADEVCEVAEVGPYNRTSLEDALTNLKYFDPAVPGTLVTVDGDAGTYSRRVNIKYIKSTVVMVNNSISRVKVDLYLFSPKVDTSITPVSAYTNGLADIGSPGATSPLVYPEDSPQLVQLYKKEKKVSKWLGPGQSMRAVCYRKGFEFDPSVYDAHTTAYNKKLGAHYWMVRACGGLSHDGTNINNINNALDCEVIAETCIHYEAGIDLKTIEVIDNGAAMTTGVMAYKQIPDILAYSST